jgi:N-acyl-D-amino-acid deacylase
MADICLKGGRIVDGTGSPWFRGDLVVEDGTIVAVDATEVPADTVVDIEGSIVAPGFIDVHTHSDFTLPANRDAHSKVRQGVTLEVVGNCGTSAAPRYGQGERAVAEGFESRGLGDVVDPTAWTTVSDYLEFLEVDGVSLNVATLVGHVNARVAAMGYDDREPTSDELDRMVSIVDAAMSEGAVGLSTGLIYPPGAYADTDEIATLAEVVADHGGFYATHVRDEGDDLLAAVEEALEIGRQADVPVQLSHHKAMRPDNWGAVRYTLRKLELARQREGIEVQADQYPYTASSTSLGALLPQWAHEGGTEELLARLEDESARSRMADELPDRVGSWDDVLVTNVQAPELEGYQGKTIAEITAEREGDPAPETVVMDLVLQDRDRIRHVNFAMDDADVETVMQHPLTMVASDGNSLATEGPLGEGVPHPRNYGTFPHVLGTYTRDRGVLDLETAVHKMTGLPAARLGLDDRGLLKPGMKADVTVFDPDRIGQGGDFVTPAVYPDGIEQVLVNGRFVVRDGEHTGNRPGVAIGRGA